MKPPKFDYHAPATVEEALALLMRYRGEAKVLAGGQRGGRGGSPAALSRPSPSPAPPREETLPGVRLPAMPAGAGYAFEEFSRRHGDFALVGIAAVVVAQGARCTKARLATAGAGPVPLRLRAPEEILERDGLGDEAVRRAAARAAELVGPDPHIHAPPDLPRHLPQLL